MLFAHSSSRLVGIFVGCTAQDESAIQLLLTALQLSLCDAFSAGNTTFALDPFDLRTQPAGARLPDLDLVAGALQVRYTSSISGARNKSARHSIASLPLGQELRQQTPPTGIKMRTI